MTEVTSPRMPSNDKIVWPSWFHCACGRAVKCEAEHEFRVAAHRVVRSRGEFAEVAHASVDVHVLRGNEWRVGGRFHDSSGAVRRD